MSNVYGVEIGFTVIFKVIFYLRRHLWIEYYFPSRKI